MKLLFLDAEFNGTTEPVLNLVSLACLATDGGKETFRREYWLHGSSRRQAEARDFLSRMAQDGYTFVAYALEAEHRSLLSLFKGEPPAYEGIDLYLEYRSLLNHNHALAYGEQLIGGKVVITKPKLRRGYWEDDAEDDEAHHRPEHGLAAACFKLLGERIDTEEKDEMRRLIISADKAAIDAAGVRIQAYNWSDIALLPRLTRAIAQEQRKHLGLDLSKWLPAAASRASYAKRTARMVALGYPVNVEKLSRFQANTSAILEAAALAVNEAAGDAPPFRLVKRTKRWTLTEKTMREWVVAQGKSRWRVTKGGALSLSKDAFGDYFDSASDGVGGAFYRYLKTKQSLNGFMPGESKRGKFTDYLGSDGRVRPYFGIYGSQSSRSQPGAIGFIPLKAHWMRTFLEAPPGKALCGVDYSSQEFLIAAVLSQDDAMMKAYSSGDVYLAFAKQAGLAPPDATRETHEAVRNSSKALVLGMSYDMGAKGLASRIGCTEKEAEDLISVFFNTYPDYKKWKQRTEEEYRTVQHLMLPDGWPIHGDNDNLRSVLNFPVQGHGAVVMRRAVALAQELGLSVVFTLHDAIYIECDSGDLEAMATLRNAMADAFSYVMSRYGDCPMVRLDGFAWSRDYAAAVPELEGFSFASEYTDDKGAKDLARYKKYFEVSPVCGAL